MNWVHWYNKDRLQGAISCQIPNEKENALRRKLGGQRGLPSRVFFVGVQPVR